LVKSRVVQAEDGVDARHADGALVLVGFLGSHGRHSWKHYREFDVELCCATDSACAVMKPLAACSLARVCSIAANWASSDCCFACMALVSSVICPVRSVIVSLNASSM